MSRLPSSTIFHLSYLHLYLFSSIDYRFVSHKFFLCLMSYSLDLFPIPFVIFHIISISHVFSFFFFFFCFISHSLDINFVLFLFLFHSVSPPHTLFHASSLHLSFLFRLSIANTLLLLFSFLILRLIVLIYLFLTCFYYSHFCRNIYVCKHTGLIWHAASLKLFTVLLYRYAMMSVSSTHFTSKNTVGVRLFADRWTLTFLMSRWWGRSPGHWVIICSWLTQCIPDRWFFNVTISRDLFTAAKAEKKCSSIGICLPQWNICIQNWISGPGLERSY